MILRPYQRELIHRAREMLRKLPIDRRRIILQAATGSGKTAVACELVRLSHGLARRVLYTVPRQEILKQTSAKLLECGLPHVLVEGGRRANVGAAAVVLAMSHTWDRRLDTLDHWTPDLIVIDECHVNAQQAARIAERWPRAAIVGLSATPDRLSDQTLTRVYSAILQGPSILELTRSGWLVPCRVLAAHQADLSGVSIRAGDYDPRGLAVSFSSSVLLGNTVQAWQTHSRGRRTIVFAATVAHSRALVERYCAAGIRAVHLDGDSDESERSGALDRLRSGSIDVLVNVGLFVEGLDLPEVETIQLATATQSLARYLQMVGRGLRPSARTGKTDLIVIDHGGNIARHGRPDQDRQWTLRPEQPRPAAAGEAPTRICMRCRLRFPIRSQVCPGCGQPVPLPAEVSTEMREVALPSAAWLAILESRRTAQRPCPPEFREVAAEWRIAEEQRARLGLPLPTGRSPGYAEKVCLAELRRR